MLGLAKRVGARSETLLSPLIIMAFFKCSHVSLKLQQWTCRILLTSTSEVYGDPLVHPQEESYWGNVNPIGVLTILLTELLIMVYLDCTWQFLVLPYCMYSGELTLSIQPTIAIKTLLFKCHLSRAAFFILALSNGILI